MCENSNCPATRPAAVKTSSTAALRRRDPTRRAAIQRDRQQCEQAEDRPVAREEFEIACGESVLLVHVASRVVVQTLTRRSLHGFAERAVTEIVGHARRSFVRDEIVLRRRDREADEADRIGAQGRPTRYGARGVRCPRPRRARSAATRPSSSQSCASRERGSERLRPDARQQLRRRDLRVRDVPA